MVTIKEIAKALGVSTATVSNVIHGRLHKMAPDTAEKVRRMLSEHGYVPNMGARMLARGDSRIIGVVTNYHNTDDRLGLMSPFVSEVIASLENEIRRKRYYMMLYAAQTAGQINAIARTWNTVGLIVMGLNAQDSMALARQVQRPLVFIDCYFAGDDAHHNVGLEDARGSYLMTQHLLAKGHRHILFISDQDPPIGVDDARLRGHRRALEEAGLSFEADHLFCIASNRRRSQDYEAILDLVGRPFTALMFCADFYAVEAMRAAQRRGMRVPEDISICGYDDNLLARLSQPRLTTVHQSISGKGVSAVDLLLRVVRNPDLPSTNITLPVRLVEGESVRTIEI